MNNVGLVLEGGGMRGIYTCGVLEYFMEKDLYFNYIIGVSAGACNAASYISRQKGRNEKVNIGYIRDRRYISFRNYVREKSIFGMDFIFDEIPNNLVSFDYETFKKADCKFLIGVTDCKTGKAVYLNKDDVDKGLYALRASASLPVVAPIVNFKGQEFLDGGLSDSIPIKKSIEDGNTKNIIVLTRNKGYRKEPIKYKNVIRSKYKEYPLLVDSILNRYKHYNETLDYVEQLEDDGKAIVIRPLSKIKVGRFEKSAKRLKEMFDEGYEDTKNCYDKIMKFISE